MGGDQNGATKQLRVYCSCGCDHLTACIKDRELLIVADPCGCPQSAQHVVMSNKPKNYRGDGVTLARKKAM